MSGVRDAGRGAALLHRFAVFVACATFLLIIAGGLVTSTGSGLAVPDWPLSYGQVFPRMEGGVLFEHGHRLLAATVGLLTVLLAIYATMSGARRGIRILGWCLVGAVVVQGILGGVTVLLRLPDSVSVAHAGLAQIFFALTVVMAEKTGKREAGSGARDTAMRISPEHLTPGTEHLALWTAILIYAQILLGAIVRHTGAGLAIPGFPTADGRLIPQFTSALVAWQFAHRVGAVLVTAMVMWSAIRIFRRHGDAPSLVRPAALLLALTSWQIFLGALTIWTWRAVTPTTAHVATGALVFVTSVVLAVRTHRVTEAQAPDESRAMMAEPAG